MRLRESYNVDTGSRFQALVLDFAIGGEREAAIVDYSEIDSLLKGLDFIKSATYDVTGLPGFQAEYQTKDGFRVMAIGTHRQSSVQTYMQFEGWQRIQMNLDQMAQLRAVIDQARQSLDALRATK